MPNPSSKKPRQRRVASKGSAKSATGAGNADTLFEQAPVAMHEIDADGIIRRVNRAECELLGFEAGDLLNHCISDFVSAGIRDVSRDAVRRKLSGEQALAPFCRELIGRDGRRVTVEIHESYIRDDAGNITGMRSALLDVSERQRAQEELRHAHEQLEARVRERTLELARANDALRNEVKERRRAEQRLAMQVAVARVLAESQDAATAVPRLLEAVGDCVGWDLGVCWNADSACREHQRSVRGSN
jgi:PAS domain S-box-containing protein